MNESPSLCPMCKVRPRDPVTRTDYQGKHWCQECQDEHDSVDWCALARESESAHFSNHSFLIHDLRSG